MNLSTRYLGLDLRSPLIAGASPVTGDIDRLMRLEDAGAAAVVLPSLFEEQIEHEEREVARVLETGTESYAEALGFFPDLQDYNTGPDRYLEGIEEARRRLAIPVIASLNAYSNGGWIRYARMMEEAGASALELNIYVVAADPSTTSADIEDGYIDLVRAVAGSIDIPVAVKVGPYFSSFANMAGRLVEAGAGGLVLFNRFYQPDIDLDSMDVAPRLVLSTSDEMRLVLRWMAILSGRVNASLAATTGIHTHEDVAKILLAGADVALLASVLIKRGEGYVRRLERALVGWLETHEYDSVNELRGSLSQLSVRDPAAFERANYMHTLVKYSSTYSS